jgi:hypothetical protein
VRVLVGIAGGLLVVLMLAEFFTTFLLPRRVKRDPRLARAVLRFGWNGWRLASRRLSPAAADTMLGLYGPLGLIGMLALWTLGLVVGFAALQWATGSHLSSSGPVRFGDDLFFSAGGFLSASTDLTPTDGFARALFLLEAACGFGVLFIAIGYLPALFQAFSRREIAVSQLDPRAGSPPTAGALVERSGLRGGWASLDAYLGEWDTWSAELMETHLSYPVLAYFRSQHLNQNWLAALTTVLDTSAFTIAAAPRSEVAESAEATFAIGRHALADLAYMFRAKPVRPDPPRLPPESFAELWELAGRSGLELRDDEAEAQAKLDALRGKYEPYAAALARWLELGLPDWLPLPEAEANWRRSGWQRGRVRVLP